MFFKNKKDYLERHELDALRATNGLLKQERYKLEIISRSLKNIYKGEQWCKTEQDIVNALEYAQSSLIRQFAVVRGYEVGTSLDIDLKDGEISRVQLPEKKETESKKDEKIEIKEPKHGTKRQTSPEVS